MHRLQTGEETGREIQQVMGKFRISQTAASMMLLSWVLFSLVSSGKSDGASCLGNDICGSDFLCCESVGGKQTWCCPLEQTCCSEEDGCCPITIPMKKLLLQGIHSNPNEKMKQSEDAAKSGNLVKLNEYKNHQKCDKGGKFLCDKKETCCKVGNSWKCCPDTNGVCCKNRNHCCPSGTTCDSTKQAGCRTEEYVPQKGHPMKSPTTKNVRQHIICPDGKRLCMDTNTCCLITNATYGCCPYEDAVCCSDLIHCCPPLTVCNTEMGICEPWGENLSPKRFRRLVKMV